MRLHIDLNKENGCSIILDYGFIPGSARDGEVDSKEIFFCGRAS